MHRGTPTEGEGAASSDGETVGGEAHARPPGPSGLPVLGNLRELARDRPAFLESTARAYGDVVRYRFGPTMEMYGLFHPDHVRRVLVEERDTYAKGDFFRSRMAFLGDSVLTSEGEKWREQRGVIEPIFHPDRITGYVDDMAAAAAGLTDEWDDGEVRDVYEDHIGLALDIVAGALFDVDISDAQDDIGGPLDTVMAHFRKKSRRPVDLPDWVPTPANVRYRRARAHLHGTVANIVSDLQDGPTGVSPPTPDGADPRADPSDDPQDGAFARLAAGFADDEGGSTHELRSQVTTLLIAGHETTAQAMTYACHLLATHPDVEERLVAEVQQVVGDGAVTADDLDDLAFTEQVVREALRLYPPVPSFPRETVDADVVDGYRIPDGTTVWVSPWVVQRDERFWDHPETFVPDRWADEGVGDRHPFAYVPFGGGPRRCLGDRFAMAEAKTVLATIYRDYHLEPVAGNDLDLAPAITLRPAGGLDFEAQAR